MKMKKLISILLAVLMIASAIPLSASAKENCYSFGSLSVTSNELLVDQYRFLGLVKVDYDVEFRSNTLYVNTSKHLRIEAEDGYTAQNVRIVFEHNANVVLNNLDIKNENSGSAITVNSGKTVNLTVWDRTSVSSLKSSAITVNGTLNLDASWNLPITSSNGYAVDGSGTLNLKSGKLTANGTKGGIAVKNFSCDSATVNATGTEPEAVGIGRSGSAMNSLKINSSVVTATGGEGAVAIGAGSNGTVNDIQITDSVVTATGGEGAAAIGAGSNGTVNNVQITKSLVTAKGNSDTGVDIGSFNGGTLKSLVIDPNSSVKGNLNITPRNLSGDVVVLNKIENPTGYSIFIDDYVLPYRDHRGERAVYVYLTIGYHDIQLNSETIYIGDFVVKSNSPSFSPASLTFDEATRTLKVNTNYSFIISNQNSVLPTSDRIFIAANASPNIVFDGVNICSSGSPVEIETDSYKDVRITLAENSYNDLVSTGDRAPAIRKAWNIYPWYNSATGKVEYFDMPCGTLTIDGTGSLYAEGGPNAAAFGTDNANNRSKNITIKSGDIIAVGGNGAPAFNCTNFKIYSDAQVYCPITFRDISWSTPTNENGNSVYQLCLEDCTNDPVYVDGVETNHKPMADRPLTSFFVSGDEHCVENGYAKVYYRRNGARFEQFTPSGDYDTGDFVVTGGEPYRDYSYSDGVLTVKAATAESAVTISNVDKNTPTTDTITVANDTDAYMILDGVNIDTSATNKAALSISSKNAGNTCIILAEGSRNILKGNSSKPTIYKSGDKKSSTLTIRGDGELSVTGNGNCAIGVNNNETFSHFYIEGGTVNLSATGDSNVIGCGEFSKIKDIVFERANITLKAENGACIGADDSSLVDSFSIYSGNVRFEPESGNIFSLNDDNKSKTVLDNFGIYGGIVTFSTPKKVFATVSAKTQISNFVINKDATVLSTKAFEKMPVNSDGENVYLCETANPDAKEIYFDGELFPYTEHNENKSVYPYLTGEYHSLSIDDTDYVLAFDSAENKFIFRKIHDHTFEQAWQHNETHHWHECTYKNCWLLSPGLYNELSDGELTASGYGEHSFDNFVCVCGFEDVSGCREYYSDRLKGLIIGSKDAAGIRKKALEDLEELTTVAEIKDCYDKCLADIDATIKELSTAIASATDEINKTLDGYKALLETEHGYNITEVSNKAENGIMSLTTSSSLETVSNTLNETLLNMKEEAVNIAKLNSSMEIEMAALNVDVPSDSVSTAASTAKKAISISDSLEDIFDITNWAISIIEKLGTDTAAEAVSEAINAAKEAVDKLTENADGDIKAYAETAKAEIEKQTTITAVTEQLTEAIAEINSMKTQKAIAAALRELDSAAASAVSSNSKAIANAAKPLIQNAASADTANAILSEALKKIANEERVLADAKTAAKTAIDNAAGSNQSAAMQAIVAEAKGNIDNAKTVQEVEAAKQAGLAKIEAQKQAEKPTEPTNPDVCQKCGHSHSNGFFGQIICFFYRLINWFRDKTGDG